MEPFVIAVSRSETHTFSKTNRSNIQLIEGFGVEGDAHAGKTVKHRYLAAKEPSRPNILQIHLIQAELFDKLEKKGFSVKPGELGENITTRKIDLLSLPTGTILTVGKEAKIKLTALRSPCKQIDDFQEGLVKEVLHKNKKGEIVMEIGVMGIVVASGEVLPGDTIQIDLPPEPFQKLIYTW